MIARLALPTLLLGSFLLSLACIEVPVPDLDSESILEFADVPDVVDTVDVTQEPDVLTFIKCDLELGEPCFEDEQCLSGICLISELTPFGVCTVPCLEAPGFCVTPDGEQHNDGWCVSLPEDEFKTLNHPELERFCIRTCSSMEECDAIHPAYEYCGDLEYKGNPIFSDTPKWVCQAPSSVGKTPVDPFTCAGWDIENTQHPNAKNLCMSYCSFLAVCQYFEPGHNITCCEWYCYLQIIDNDKVDEEYKDKLTNHVEWFSNSKGSSLQCEGEKQFGPPIPPDADAPVPVEGQCR